MALSFTTANDKANQRVETLNFWRKNGLTATLDTYKHSKRPLHRWQAQLDAHGGSLAALCIKSGKPKRLGTSSVGPWLKI